MYVHDDVLDAALNYIKNNATRLSVCSTEPTTYAQATSTYMLAMKTISSTDFGSPANGSVSGRKIAVNAQDNVTISASGDGQYVALCDAATSKLLYVTTCTLKELALGNNVNFPSWPVELEDPETV
jgi:hypothetical protein